MLEIVAPIHLQEDAFLAIERAVDQAQIDRAVEDLAKSSQKVELFAFSRSPSRA